MNILTVGAGAVGKVYGRHLALGGAKVSFYVKEKYATKAREGFYFYPLNDSRHRKSPLLWKNFRVITESETVKNEKWDYVLLAMASPALRSGWLEDFLKLVPLSTIITLQPGLLDKDYLLKTIPPARLIDGTIPITSFEAPLPLPSQNSTEPFLKPGTAYWFPPGSFAGFSGEPARVRTLVETLKRGKFPAKEVEDARKLNVVAGPALALLVSGLKKCNWSFSEFSKSRCLPLVSQAAREAIAIQAKHVGVKNPATFFLTPLFLKSLLWTTKQIAPFDFEAFLKVHFLKVDDQMVEILNDAIRLGDEYLLSTVALKEIIKQ